MRAAEADYQEAMGKYKSQSEELGVGKRTKTPTEKVKQSGGDDDNAVLDARAPQRATFERELPVPPSEDASELLVVTEDDIKRVRESPEKIQARVDLMFPDHRGHRVEAALQKANELTNGRLLTTLDIMRASRLFNFAFVALNSPVALIAEIKKYMGLFGCIAANPNKDDIIESLIKELVSADGYYEQAKLFMKENYDMVTIAGKKEIYLPMPYEMWRFWKQNALLLPKWADVSNNVALIATSSADSERGFSMYSGLISNQQKSSLEDKIEATVLIRHNWTQRRLEAKQLQEGRKTQEALLKMNRDMRAAACEGVEEDD